jgi:hypothetical protein
MSRLLTFAAAAILTNVCLSSGLSAEGHTPEIPQPMNRFSVGAGYEHREATWESDAFWISSGRIDQRRFYIRAAVLVAERWEIHGRVGIADMKATEFAPEFHRQGTLIDNGIAPFVSLGIEGPLLGAPRDSPGAAIDLALEVSAPVSHKDEREGYLATMWGERLPVNVRAEIKERWEGSLSVLFRTGNGRISMSCGPSLMRSGARCLVDLEAGGVEDTWSGYIENTHEIVMTGAVRLNMWSRAAVDAQVLIGPATYTRLRLTL